MIEYASVIFKSTKFRCTGCDVTWNFNAHSCFVDIWLDYRLLSIEWTFLGYPGNDLWHVSTKFLWFSEDPFEEVLPGFFFFFSQRKRVSRCVSLLRQYPVTVSRSLERIIVSKATNNLSCDLESCLSNWNDHLAYDMQKKFELYSAMCMIKRACHCRTY